MTVRDHRKPQANSGAKQSATERTDWHVRRIEELLAGVGATPSGLSAPEARQRLLRYGPNVLAEGKPIRPFAIFLAQFKSILIWILIAAAVISGVLGDLIDTVAILAIVVLNAVIGFYQELSAEKSIAALRQLTAPRARVRRDNQSVTIPAAEAVPGDILELEAGDLVAADARLLEATSLRCVESALTGESEPVDKEAGALEDPELPLGDRRNMVFMGTSVAAGQGRAVVVSTAMNTEIGRIAGLIEDAGAESSTPLQKRLSAFARALVWVSLGIVALLFVLGLARRMNVSELFLTSVSLAVAAVPEGLPAVVTVALALGVLRMSRRRALVRRLPSVETLGSANVICTDKTGTLTVGEMTVRELYVAGQSFEVTGEGYGPQGEVLFEGKASDARHAGPLLELANVLIGCNNAHLLLEHGKWKVIGDPTEGALAAAGHKAGADKRRFEETHPKHHEIPFDSDRKRRTVVRVMPDGRLRALINGAPDELLRLCTRVHTDDGARPMTDVDQRAIAARNADMAGRALRVLGSAYREIDNASPEQLTAGNVERDLVFVGLTGMHDPPRAEAKEAIAKCRSAGIRVVMITGDHPRTAAAIARELGLANGDSAALSGRELDKLSDRELRDRAPSLAVYARLSAAHKLRIVRAWKSHGAVVAMTGDGVNDAPAIKGADIGIAMGRSGTEVTKQASDMIITDDNFASIVAAVEEGRGVYDNIRKTLQYLLASNAGELVLMTTSIALGLPLPLLPIHLLWINLISDGPPALCLAADPVDPGALERPPRAANERLADTAFLWRILLTGVSSAALALGVFLYALKFESLEKARTLAFAVLVFTQLLLPFTFRSERKPIWRIPLWSNWKLVAVVVLSFVIQIGVLHAEFPARLLKATSITPVETAQLLGLAILPLGLLEAVKLLSQRQRRSA